MQGVLTGTANRVEPGVHDEGNAPLCEARAKLRAIAVAKRVIEDGPGQTVMLDEEQSMLKRVRGRQRGTSSFERLRDVLDDQWLILDDED